jgi:hypothetical protein
MSFAQVLIPTDYRTMPALAFGSFPRRSSNSSEDPSSGSSGRHVAARSVSAVGSCACGSSGAPVCGAGGR